MSSGESADDCQAQRATHRGACANSDRNGQGSHQFGIVVIIISANRTSSSLYRFGWRAVRQWDAGSSGWSAFGFATNGNTEDDQAAGKSGAH